MNEDGACTDMTSSVAGSLLVPFARDASVKLVREFPSPKMCWLRFAGSSKNFIASDVMWSDPVNAPGLRPNDARGCGTVYGPDVTQVRRGRSLQHRSASS
jgi:hypothetical protein